MRGDRPFRRDGIGFRRGVFAGVATLIMAANVSNAAESGLAIGELLKSGWQIAGYSQAVDNRSTFILFRHPEHKLSRAMPGGLRCNPNPEHLFDLL